MSEKKASSRTVMVAGLFGVAIVWILLMGLVSWAFGSKGIAGTIPPDDGSVKAQITNLDRDKEFNVSLSVKLTDADGKVIEGLGEQDIDVYENGEKVSYLNFAPAGQGPVRLALVIDATTTMRNAKISEARNSAFALLRMLTERDYFGLYFFNGNLFEQKKMEQLPVAPLDLVKPDGKPGHREQAWMLFSGVGNGILSDDTPLLIGIQVGVDGVKKVNGRRVVIVLTDGMDTSEGDELKKEKDKLLDQCKELNLALYLVNVDTDSAGDDQSKKAADDLLGELATTTGGKYFRTAKPEELKDIFIGIGKGLQNEYGITYKSPNPREDGVTRRVTVVARNGKVGSKDKKDYTVPGVVAAGAGSFGKQLTTLATIFVVLAAVLAAFAYGPSVIGHRAVAAAEEARATAAPAGAITASPPAVRPASPAQPRRPAKM